MQLCIKKNIIDAEFNINQFLSSNCNFVQVQPDLVVDVKPSLRQRKLPGQKMQRMMDEMWARRRMHKVSSFPFDFVKCKAKLDASISISNACFSFIYIYKGIC